MSSSIRAPSTLLWCLTDEKGQQGNNGLYYGVTQKGVTGQWCGREAVWQGLNESVERLGQRQKGKWRRESKAKLGERISIEILI